MSQLQFRLSNSYKIFKQSIAIVCSILAICLLSASTQLAVAQSSDDQQSVQVFIGKNITASYQIPEGKVVSIPVTVQSLDEGAKIGAISARVHYDTTLLQVTGCKTDPTESFDFALCNYETEAGVIAMNGVRLEGISGILNLALLEFHALGSAGQQTDLELEVKQVTDLQGKSLTSTGQSSSIEITDAGVSACTPTSATVCSEYRVYLPTIIN